jgi:hypothetical protein
VRKKRHKQRKRKEKRVRKNGEKKNDRYLTVADLGFWKGGGTFFEGRGCGQQKIFFRVHSR